MRSETIQQRMRLIRRLLRRSTSFQINDVPVARGRGPQPYSAEAIRETWRRLVAGLAEGELVGHYYNLYLHIPFCRAKCTYCMYDSRVLSDRAPVAAYLDFLERQLEFFAPALAEAPFQNLHVGGGTPTSLDEERLRRLFEALFGAMRFADDGSKVIETNPENVTSEKASLLTEFGFNKISVGVQSMDRSVLERHGRGYQTAAQVQRAIERLRAAGAPYVNCDFMLGLAGDGAETFLRGLGELMELGPDTIMLTKLQPQWGYLRRHFDGNYDNFVAHYDGEFASAVEPMLALGQRHGYVTDNPFDNELGWRLWKRDFRPSYDAERPYYCTGGQLPMSTLGLGRFAKSKIFGRLIYENVHAEPTFDPAAPHFRGQEVDRRYEATRWVVTQIASRRSLDKGKFQNYFGATLEQTFPYVVESLLAQGAVQADGATLSFPATDTKELFVLSRLFLDRQAVIQELVASDWDALAVALPGEQLRFLVEHAQPEHEPYAGKCGDLALRLEAPAEPADPSDRSAAKLVVAVMLELFDKATQERPWLSAVETAEWMANKAAPLLERDLDAAVTLESRGVV